MDIGDRVKFRTFGGWYNSGIIRDINDDSYLIEVDELGQEPPKDVYISLPYYARILKSEVEECQNDILTKYEVEMITRGNCMMCGKELTEGLFFCKECESKLLKEKKYDKG